ncbi:hypothetical protein FH972_024661 [Carpinus fangiana]|uniref:Muconate cycloisomerase 1 n=1 Tax=Carpinus fangiana TaxID=176857 RepID=A0A5N6KYM2_9ROSI|nr:hypothetical protein FH972_024661 [Carpinus fangiana]
MDFIVGTFNTPDLYTLRFTPGASSKLDILKHTSAIGSHSWLALSQDRKSLYATCWLEPPSIAAYRVTEGVPELINNKPIKSRSGYTCCSATHVYSAGGSTGDVYSIGPDGGLLDHVQEISFVEDEKTGQAGGSGVKHGDFGGLRHGAHSADLSRDGNSLYVADIGRNCIWTYSINHTASAGQPHLTLGSKHISPRPNDGPRHCTAHPNGKVLYSLQEHTSMVDVFSVAQDGTTLKHITGVKIIPAVNEPKHYWADEVRLSAPTADGRPPMFLYASTRGLEASTMGYVAVFEIDEDGMVVGDKEIDMYETPTSGGWANAVEPAPRGGVSAADEKEYLALTDSEEGWVFVLSFDGNKIREEARVNLGKSGGNIAGAATAVWL